MNCEICPREEKDQQVFDFLNYTQRLPREIFTHFLRQHLEEDKKRKPFAAFNNEALTPKNLHEMLKNS